VNKETVKVLLINGSEDDFIEMSHCLGAHDDYLFEIEWKDNYDDGLKRAVSNGYDVCFLDSMLGDREGIELVNRARERGCKNPIILLSEDDEEFDEDVIKIAEIEGVLPKDDLCTDRVVDEVSNVLSKTKRYDSLKEQAETFQSSHDSSIEQATLSIIENLPDPVMVLDRQGKVVVVNKRFCELMSLSSEEILGVNATLFLNCSSETLLKAIDGKEHRVFRTSAKMDRADRQQIYWNFAPVSGGKSKSIALVATGHVKNGFENRTPTFRKKGVFYGFKVLIDRLIRSPLYVKNNGVHYHGDIFK
jgi:PAS domain S-box-containing protein